MSESDQKPMDIGQALIVKMVEGMVSLAKSNDLLAQKIEDLTSAVDDVRERLDGSTEMSDELSGYVGAVLKILEDTSSVGADREVKWSDIKDIIADMKRTAEEEAEEEEEEVER